MLHEGRIVAQGTVEDLDRSDNELVRAFMQSKNACDRFSEKAPTLIRYERQSHSRSSDCS
jgi:ABC-type transporter Mla maintaining outer membrane lipid asymmetry ATPase subunit MlaF